MPRFSIVLTTTDRQALLPAAIRSVLAMDFADYELIISDNFSHPSAAEIVSGFDDKRIRYLRTDRRINMADHWEFVWEHVRGDYVMFMGDDNALHPNILSFADRAIAEHGLELLSWRVCQYYHPDWNVAFTGLTRRANVLTFEPGTTGRLFRSEPARILQSYCDELKLQGIFPSMLNLLFSRDHAVALRRRAGRLFWPIAPDMSLSYLLMGTIRPSAFGLLDAYGAIGGRSQNSILAGFLSKGQKSRRADELFAEYQGTEPFPHHPVKFNVYSNVLAATVSQARALIPERFGTYDYAARTLALRTIDDIYTLEMTPWADDPEFLAEVETFFQSLPRVDRAAVLAYRRECVDRRDKRARRARDEISDTDTRDDRRLWVAGDTYYIDMTLLGGRDIADAVRQLPQILRLLNHDSDRFIGKQRVTGHVSDEIVCTRPWTG